MIKIYKDLSTEHSDNIIAMMLWKVSWRKWNLKPNEEQAGITQVKEWKWAEDVIGAFSKSKFCIMAKIEDRWEVSAYSMWD